MENNNARWHSWAVLLLIREYIFYFSKRMTEFICLYCCGFPFVIYCFKNVIFIWKNSKVYCKYLVTIFPFNCLHLFWIPKKYKVRRTQINVNVVTLSLVTTRRNLYLALVFWNIIPFVAIMAKCNRVKTRL